jgi:hypothetical protein
METIKSPETVLDAFEKKRDEWREVLKTCQKERGLTSCFICEATFECETRERYVAAVYLSMSKGKGGGFEF